MWPRWLDELENGAQAALGPLVVMAVLGWASHALAEKISLLIGQKIIHPAHRIIAYQMLIVIYMVGWFGAIGDAGDPYIHVVFAVLVSGAARGLRTLLHRPRVILVTGYKGAGKDTAADMMDSIFRARGIDVRHGMLARPLKDYLCGVLQTLYPDAQLERGMFDSVAKDTATVGGVLLRRWMQEAGTQARVHFGTDIHSRVLCANLRPGTLTLVTDVRFPDDVSRIAEVADILAFVRIDRRSAEPSASASAHVSEVNTQTMQTTHTIDNNGTLADLQGRVDHFAKSIRI